MPSVNKQNVTSKERTRTDLWSSQAKDLYHGIGRLLRSETGNPFECVLATVLSSPVLLQLQQSEAPQLRYQEIVCA